MDATDNTTEAEKRDAAFRAQGIDPATGFATDGEWPINLRLRAEAMAAAGVSTDPQSLVSDELIASTKDRLAAEERERIQADKTAPTIKWSRDRLVEAAAKVGVVTTDEMDKATILAAIEAAPAATGQEG